MAQFTQRTEAPATSNAYYYADNPFYQSGYGLPNCTCYAFGRFWEIKGGSRPSLSWGNAEDWWAYTSDGYERGQTPKLGAVICWRKGRAGDNSDGAGHVEVVEAINADGTIVTTGSAWQSFLFRTKTRSNDGNWGGGDYIFQGFIYNPVDFESGDNPGNTYKPTTPVSGNRYLTSAERHQNAEYIAWYLLQRGWTLNAIAGMLGNMETESTINPGIWENLTTDPEVYYAQNGRYPGFGLVQWTPYTKLTNWASSRGLNPNSMDTQLQRIIWEQETENGQFSGYGTQYDMTFTEFKNSLLSPYELGLIFLACYERPKDPNQPSRGTQAEYWYTYLSGINFPSGGGSWSGSGKRKRFNFVLFGNKQWRNPV